MKNAACARWQTAHAQGRAAGGYLEEQEAEACERAAAAAKNVAEQQPTQQLVKAAPATANEEMVEIVAMRRMLSKQFPDSVDPEIVLLHPAESTPEPVPMPVKVPSTSQAMTPTAALPSAVQQGAAERPTGRALDSGSSDEYEYEYQYSYGEDDDEKNIKVNLQKRER